MHIQADFSSSALKHFLWGLKFKDLSGTLVGAKLASLSVPLQGYLPPYTRYE